MSIRKWLCSKFPQKLKISIDAQNFRKFRGKKNTICGMINNIRRLKCCIRGMIRDSRHDNDHDNDHVNEESYSTFLRGRKMEWLTV